MRRLEQIGLGPAAAAVAVLAITVYATTIGHAFTWNDGTNIVANTGLQDPSNIPSFFTAAWGEVSDDAVYRARNSNYWRPIALTSFAIDHALWGLVPGPFHATNVLLHALAAMLVLLIGWRLFPEAGRARVGVLLGAALWAVHPLHTEVVDVVSYRSDLLAGVGYLGALAVWLAPRGRGRAAEWRAVAIWAPLLYFVGVGSKEMAVTVPAAVALADLLVPPHPLALRERALRLMPITLTALAYLAIRAALLESSPYSYFGDAPGSTVAFTMLGVFGLYGRLLIAPWPLNPFYDWSVLPPEPTLLAAAPLIGLTLLVAWVAVIACAWRRAPRIAWLLALYLVCLIPVSQAIPVVVAAAERFLYVAALGPLLAVSVMAATSESLQNVRGIVLGALVVLLLGFTTLTVARTADWQTDRTILEANVRDFPRSYNAWFGLAKLHEREGRVPEATEIYRRLERYEDVQRLGGRP